MWKLTGVAKNWDLIVGLALSASVAILGLLGVISAETITAAVLAVLALQLAVFFVMRETLRKISSELSRVGADHTSKSFQWEYPDDLRHKIASAREIRIIAGGTFRTTLYPYIAEFQRAVERGLDLKLCCSDPRDAGTMTALALKRGEDAASVTRSIEASLEAAASLTKRARKQNSNAKVEVRLLKSIPEMGSIFISMPPHSNGYNSADELLVKLYTHKWGQGRGIVFTLTKKLDADFFDQLHQSGTDIWTDAVVYPFGS